MWAIAYIVGWSIAFFVSWLFKGEEPSVLEGCILAPGVVELVACAFIKTNQKGGEIDQGTDCEETDQP